MAKRKSKNPVASRVFGSPIEVMMRNTLCLSANAHGYTLFDYSTSTLAVEALVSGGGVLEIQEHSEEEWSIPAGMREYGSGDNICCLYGGVQIESYKADLLLVAGLAHVLIECDGHEWHDRTKQQASYDRARDRWFLARGIPTARFTGSEIHHSAERCAADAFAVLKAHERVQDIPREMWDLGYKRGVSEGTNTLHVVKYGIDGRGANAGRLASDGLLAGLVL